MSPHLAVAIAVKVWIDILEGDMTINLALNGRLPKSVSAFTLLIVQSIASPLSAQAPKLANPNATSVSLISLPPSAPRLATRKVKVKLMRQVSATLSGMASWYGRVLQGHHTASGERFDMNDLTACHRTLPFGTRVRVTNLSNRESVIVRITDRGVLNADRVIDLSAAAADKIGMLRAGLAPVSLSILPAS